MGGMERPCPIRGLSQLPGDEQMRYFAGLARRAGYSPRRMAKLQGVTLRHLQRHFRSHFGCTPRAWINEHRLEEARARLGSAESVKQVAYEAGFKQVSHFCREFKRVHGLRPSALLGHALASHAGDVLG